MTSRTFDVVGVGNALVDVVARVDESFLLQHNLAKGTMRLIEAEEAVRLYDSFPPAQETSGGSAANTLAAFASLGGTGAFVARIGSDSLGDVFAHDLRAQGVGFSPKLRDTALPTGRCLIAVTPDGERTMNTALGCNLNFCPGDVDMSTIAAARVVYLEGYLFDQPAAKEAYRMASLAARKSGCSVALTLSDRFCVERHRMDFLGIVHNDVDILFANASEITALYQTTNFDEAAQAAAAHCPLCVLTHGAEGAVVYANGQRTNVPAVKVPKVVDLTGAGDAFAAGFLYGQTHGMDVAHSGSLGAHAAAEVISHMGARPETRLSTLLVA